MPDMMRGDVIVKINMHTCICGIHHINMYLFMNYYLYVITSFLNCLSSVNYNYANYWLDNFCKCFMLENENDV